jgi:hypothetical protein
MNTAKREIRLRRANGFSGGCQRNRFAACMANVVGMNDCGSTFPSMPQKGDTHCWSIDKNGDGYWIVFDKTDENQFTLSCRYDDQAPLLEALANYVAIRTYSIIMP